MSIIFYDHLIDKTEITAHIRQISPDIEHQTRLRQIIDEILHHSLLEFLLQKLHPHKHDSFLERLHSSPYDPQIIIFLKDNLGPDVEDQIQSELQTILDRIKKDLSL